MQQTLLLTSRETLFHNALVYQMCVLLPAGMGDEDADGLDAEIQQIQATGTGQAGNLDLMGAELDMEMEEMDMDADLADGMDGMGDDDDDDLMMEELDEKALGDLEEELMALEQEEQLVSGHVD